MGAQMTVRCGTATFGVTKHALERYGERVMPALDGPPLFEQLRRVMLLAEWTTVQPDWLVNPEPTDGWLVLDGSIVFPVRGGWLMTCLTRHAPSDAGRERRREYRADTWDRAPAPGRRKKHGKVARDERRRRRDAKAGID